MQVCTACNLWARAHLQLEGGEALLHQGRCLRGGLFWGAPPVQQPIHSHPGRAGSSGPGPCPSRRQQHLSQRLPEPLRQGGGRERRSSRLAGWALEIELAHEGRVRPSWLGMGPLTGNSLMGLQSRYCKGRQQYVRRKARNVQEYSLPGHKTVALTPGAAKHMYQIARPT